MTRQSVTRLVSLFGEDPHVKAKMPPNQKPQEPGEYECIWCETIFEFAPETNKFECPKCGNKARQDLVPIYMTNQIEDDTMYTSADFGGGD